MKKNIGQKNFGPPVISLIHKDYYRGKFISKWG